MDKADHHDAVPPRIPEEIFSRIRAEWLAQLREEREPGPTNRESARSKRAAQWNMDAHLRLSLPSPQFSSYIPSYFSLALTLTKDKAATLSSYQNKVFMLMCRL